MKNKTKKILAGACLGLFGIGLLTGCSKGITDEQQQALDKVIGKADEAIELIEKQNEKLTFVEAVKLYDYATTKLLVNSNNVWDNLKIKMRVETTGDFLEGSGNVSNFEYHLYKKNAGNRVAYGKFSKSSTSDPSVNSYELGELFDDSISSSDYVQESYRYIRDMLDFGEVTEENIVDVELTENSNYIISLVADIEFEGDVSFDLKISSGDLKVPTLVVCEITADGQMVSKKYVSIVDENAQFQDQDSEYHEFECTLTYEYGSLTDTEVQENINAILSE